MQHGSFNWVVALVARPPRRIGVGAAPARSAVSPFELVVQGRAVDVILDGTFTSSAIGDRPLQGRSPFAQACAGPGYRSGPPRGLIDPRELFLAQRPMTR